MQNNGQKRRRKMAGRALPFNRQALVGAVALLAAVTLLIIGLYPRGASAPDLPDTPQVEGAEAGTQPSKVEAGSELVQQMTYSRCGHELVRRTTLPQELVGKTRQDVEAAYDGWQVTEFLPKQVTMARLLTMYCADHVVLMPDESGVLGVFENKYGDAMAFVQSLQTGLDTLPENVQEEVRQGKGFDTMEDMQQWLENIES